MREMRKKSREMDSSFALEVLAKAPYVTVGMLTPEGLPYAVPLSLAMKDDKTFYFHGAQEGLKMECIQASPIVSLTAVTMCKPTVGPKDDSFTLQYKSAMAYGKAEIVSDEQEKIEALRLICERYLPQHMKSFASSVERSLSRTAVVRITLTEPPTGKRKMYDKQGEEMKWQRQEQNRFRDIFIDFDDTIYDTRGNAEIALKELFEHYELGTYFKSLEDFTVPFWTANQALWAQYAHGEIERDFLMVERIRRPLAVGVRPNGEHLAPTREECLAVSDYYLDLCSVKPGTVKDAHRVMQYLKSKGYRLHICSNGFREVQFRKLKASALDQYFDTIVLSEDAGANKPSKEFFEYALKVTGASVESTVMIGDNILTDIGGAKGVGLKTILYDRWSSAVDHDMSDVDWKVDNLIEIENIL